MFYIVSTDGQIVDTVETRPTLDAIKELAQDVQSDLYVIEGERAGIEYALPNLSVGSPVGMDYMF